MTDDGQASAGDFKGTLSREEYDAALEEEFSKLPAVLEGDVWSEVRDGPISQTDMPVVYVGGPTHGQTSNHDPGTALSNSVADGDGDDVAGIYARTVLTVTLFGDMHVVYGWTGHSLG